MTLLQRLQSNNFAIWLSITACIILCPNMMYVFYHIGAEMATWESCDIEMKLAKKIIPLH